MTWRIESDGTLRGNGRTIPQAPGKSIRALVRAGVDEQGIAEVEHYVRDEQAARASRSPAPSKRARGKVSTAEAWMRRLFR